MQERQTSAGQILSPLKKAAAYLALVQERMSSEAQISPEGLTNGLLEISRPGLSVGELVNTELRRNQGAADDDRPLRPP